MIVPGPRVEPVERAGEEVPARGAGRDRRRSASRAGSRRARSSSTRSSCTATWPTWATCAAWPSTRPPPRTSSSSPTSRPTTGVTPDLVRLSVGIESIDDILADLDAGLPRRQVADAGDRGVRPGHGRLAAGGRSRPPAVRHLRRRPEARGRWSPRVGRRSPTRRGARSRPTRRTRCSCCTRSTATATPPGPPDRATATSAGGTASSDPGCPIDTDRFFVVCPNVLGGCQGTTGPSSDAPDGRPYGSRFPRHHDPRPGRARGRARRRARHRPLVRGRRRLDGRHARARVGRRSPRACRARGRRSPSARRRPRRRSRCATCRCAPSAPTRSGAAATTTTPSPATARTKAWPSRAASATSATAPSSSSRRGSGATTKPVRNRSSAAATRWSRTSTTRATSSSAASTPTPTSCSREAMNHHDVGRDRGGIAAALATITADVTHRGHVVGLALPGAPAAGARRADPDVVDGRDRADHLRPRRLPRRVRRRRRHPPPRPRLTPRTSRSSTVACAASNVEMFAREGVRATASRAWWRSATRSSVVSMPTERRTSVGSTASGESTADAWVMRAGCSMSDSTPPSDSASVNSRVRATSSSAVSSPPNARKLTMPPKSRIWRRAMAWPGWSASPGRARSTPRGAPGAA